MFKCRDIGRQASDYREGELPATRRLRFAFHLLLCGRCRAFMRQLELASRVYRGLGDRASTRLDENAARVLAGDIIARAGDAANAKPGEH